MNYTVTRPLKSKGLAAFLALVPFGLFYSSIWGAIIMYFVVPLLIVFSIFENVLSVASIIILIPLYIIICIIWAVVAVADYNREIIHGATYTVPLSNLNRPQSVADELSDKKSEIYKNLETVKGLYDKNVIDEIEYNQQKDSLLKKLEVLNQNETSSQTPAYNTYNVEPDRRSNVLIWILVIVLLLSFVFLSYEKGFFSSTLFDRHSKDKALIKEQIEKTYFGISNGAYTSQTIQGEGLDNLPFYNSNLKDAMAMGLVPLANYLGLKVSFEPRNIDVYDFKDDNTAEVRYDLVEHNDDEIDTGKINMEVRKIGGSWKLDGEKAFGIEQKKIEKRNSNKRNQSTSKNEDDDNYIDKSFLENSNDSALKVVQSAPDERGPFIDETDDRYFIFEGKKIYMILNGKIEKILHKTKEYMDDEYQITETKERYIFSEFGNITVNKPNGDKVTYETEVVPINSVYLEDQYIR